MQLEFKEWFEKNAFEQCDYGTLFNAFRAGYLSGFDARGSI